MKRDIENRLISFSVRIYRLTEKLNKDSFSSHLISQLIRSGTSAALNYGEAQGAESRKDFIHKIGVVIKELRESLVNIKIIQESQICSDELFVNDIIRENNELIAIFFATLKTARKGLDKKEG
jgi:four helix bundle protein